MTTADEMRQETTPEAEDADRERYACRECGTPFETHPDGCPTCGSDDIADLIEVLNPDFRE